MSGCGHKQCRLDSKSKYELTQVFKLYLMYLINALPNMTDKTIVNDVVPSSRKLIQEGMSHRGSLAEFETYVRELRAKHSQVPLNIWIDLLANQTLIHL